MNQHILRTKLNCLQPMDRRYRVSVLVGLLFSGLFLVAGGVGFAAAEDAPATQWSQTYGGTDFESVDCVIKTSDGGYALAGSTRSFGAGGWDVWLVKTDAIGNVQWTQTYGGTDSDSASCVIQTNDGGFALSGSTRSFGAGLSDAWLVKTDALGTLQWNQTYGGIDRDGVSCVIQTNDGGYALSGFTESYGAGNNDFWLIKTDTFGSLQWNQTYGDICDESAICVVETSGGGYVLAGNVGSFSAGFSDFWLVKTDTFGTMLWNHTYGGTNLDYAHCMIQTMDKGFAIVGETYSFHDEGLGGWDWNYWLVKTDASGSVWWTQTYGSIDDEYAYCVAETSDAGYAIAGYVEFFGASGSYTSDAWLVKTDALGTLEWSETYGGINKDYARCVVETGVGGYALAGETESFGSGNYDFWLVKLGPDTLFVVPESPLGAAAALAAGIAALSIVVIRKHKKPTN